MRYAIFLVLLVILAACSNQEELESQVSNGPDLIEETDPTQASEPTVEIEIESEPQVDLPNLGPAPELTNEVWLNIDKPLRLADLKGNVVLLEMWTFG